MKKDKILGYMFDCRTFQYENQMVTGLCCAIRVKSYVPDQMVCKYVSIHLSQKRGFQIINKSKYFNVQLYQIYILALCDNEEEEAIEIDEATLMSHAEYIIEDESACAESRWFVDKC